MKRRLLNIVFALVLLLSLGLVTAAPAVAMVNLSVTVSPDTASTADADYNIFFTTQAMLAAGTDTITVVFPDDTGVTPGSLAGTVAVAAGADIPITTMTGNAVARTVTITTPVSASNGNMVKIKLTGGITNPSSAGMYTLSVETSQEPGLVTFPSYEITGGAPPPPITTLTVEVQPSDTSAGETISPAVQVKAVDGGGTPISGLNIMASLIGTGTLSGTLTQATDGSGIATFDDLSIDVAGTGKVLHFADNGNTVDSNPFEILVGPVAGLAVVTQPSNTVAGVIISPAVQVKALDDFGNLVVGQDIAVTLISGMGGLVGTTTQITDGSGIATFNDLWINVAGIDKKLRFTADSVISDSDTFTIFHADLAKYHVITEFVTYIAGVPFDVTIEAVDPYGNLLGADYVPDGPYQWVTTASNAPDGTPPDISAPLEEGDFTAGVAVKTVTLYCAEEGVLFTAVDDSGFGGTSWEKTILPGDAVSIVVSPDDTTITADDTQEYTAQATDSWGNIFSVTEVTTFVIDGDHGGTWLDNLYSAGYVGEWQVQGQYDTLTDNATLTVTPGAVADLDIIDEPSDTIAGLPIGPLTVKAVDQHGNPVPGATIDVSENGGYVFDAGQLQQDTGVDGIATFADLVINTAATGYQLHFASGVAAVDSDSFEITPAEFAAYTVLPEDVTYTAGIPFDVTITATDQFGNPVGDEHEPGGDYTWETNASDAPYGDEPDIGTVVADDFSDGVATKNVTLYCAEDGVTFTVTDNTTATGTSDGITVIHGEDITSFVISPDDKSITADDTQEYTSNAADTWGNEFSVTDVTTFSIEDGAGGEWDGNLYEPGYVGVWLVKGDYSPWTDNTTLTVTPGVAFELIIADGTQPTDTRAGEAISPVTVVVKDEDGNVIPGQEIIASLLGDGTLNSVSGNLTLVSNASGNVTFDDLWIDLVGEKQLRFTADAKSVDSNPFMITPGATAAFTFVTIPSPQDAGVSFEITVNAVDAFGNPTPAYIGTANLTDLTGTIEPAVTDNFTVGVWTDNVTLHYGHPMFETMEDTITATDTVDIGITGTSDPFTLKPYAVYNDDTGKGYASIQEAIDDASPGDTIIVGPGEYVEDLTIDKDLTLVSSHGPTETKLTGTGANPVVEVGDHDITIHGFEIDPGLVGVGIPVISAGTTVTIEDDVIYGNMFGGIYVGSDNGTLNIFNSLIAENGGFGIYIGSVDGGGSANITGNVIGAWEDDYYDLVGNGEAGIDIDGIYNGSTVTIEGNIISQNLGKGIYVGELDAGSLEVLNNDIKDNRKKGIRIYDVYNNGSADIHYNSIVGNDWSGNQVGIKYDYDSEEEYVDATCNWWGDVAGPCIETNPYYETDGDAVSRYVNYIPWLVQSELDEGWNIWSRPIVPDENSWEELVATFDGAPAAYFFNSETQYWDSPANAGPLDAFYFKMAEATTIRYCINSEATFPSQKAMKMGWNLVGLAELHEMEASEALLDAYWGTGVAEDLTGYSKVISLSLNGEFWNFLRPAIMKGPSPYMLPCKGYWVFMVNDGTLGGFTTTPIVEVAP